MHLSIHTHACAHNHTKLQVTKWVTLSEKRYINIGPTHNRCGSTSEISVEHKITDLKNFIFCRISYTGTYFIGYSK